ncbi:MAG: sulfatase-like hydrolase/transferase [Verrucomicrobiae bacterium]|nr:sulfatase-like hydrolase/transferase [Verrucomicrobiae bacterium]
MNFSANLNLIGIGLFVSFLSGVSAADRPNILFVLADDVSYRNVSCFPGSYPWAKTPGIDALASEGMKFTRGYVGTWCMASRVTLMTGRQQYGNESMKLDLLKYPAAKYDPEKMPLWPSALRRNGYQTAMIGKWHIGEEAGWGEAWDHQRVWNRCKHPHNAHAYYEAQLIETDGGEAELIDGYPTDFYTDWAIDYIQGKNRSPDKPWFLWLCYGASHGPFVPAERDSGSFPETFTPAPADVFPPRSGKPRYMQKVNTWERGDDGRPKLKEFHTPKGSTVCRFGEDLSDWNRQYQQTIKSLDDNLGRLIKALDESGQGEETLVVFTADQGFAFGQHGFATKMAPYDANIRPPLIFRHPGNIPEDSVCHQPVTGSDIVSTLLAKSETPEPWFMHGHDFSALLADPDLETWDHGTLLALTGIEWGDDTRHLPKLIKHIQGIPWWISFSKGSYKYIRTLERNEIEEFYDLEKDPEELTNLALDPSYHDLIRSMREEAVAELSRTQAPFLKDLPKVFVLDQEVSENFHKAGDPDRPRQEAAAEKELKERGVLSHLHPFHQLFDLH